MGTANFSIDEDAMNIDFGNFQGAHYTKSEVTDHQNPLSGACVTPVASFHRLDIVALTPESLKDTNSPVSEASVGIGSPEAVLHQVSISLACTTEQLSKIMTGLASTGSVVNIKIDTQ